MYKKACKGDYPVSYRVRERRLGFHCPDVLLKFVGLELVLLAVVD